MATSLTTRRDAALAPPREDALRPHVRTALDRWRDPTFGRTDIPAHHPDNQRDQIALTGDDQRNAEQALGAIEACLAAAVTNSQIEEWLTLVNLTCRNPVQTEEFDGRVGAYAVMLRDLPGFVFSLDAARRLDSGFFPSAHDVRKAVQPDVDEAIRLRDGLRAVVARGRRA